LLHAYAWPRKYTYAYLYDDLANKILKKYGKNSIIVFDGYRDTELSTKSLEQGRRAQKYAGRHIRFTDNMEFNESRENFLASNQNKERFIERFTEFLKCTFNSLYEFNTFKIRSMKWP
jgi:hypothetical protein